MASSRADVILEAHACSSGVAQATRDVDRTPRSRPAPRDRTGGPAVKSGAPSALRRPGPWPPRIPEPVSPTDSGPAAVPPPTPGGPAVAPWFEPRSSAPPWPRGPSAAWALRPAAARPETTPDRGAQALLGVRHQWHRRLGRGRWRGRAVIGDQVAQGHVDLMTDGRHGGHRARGDRPRHPLVVERAEIFLGARRPVRL